MEKILDVYKRPFDQKHRVICLDEKPYQLIGQVQTPIIRSDGVVLEDYEYVRNGVAQIVMCFEPLAGKRYVKTKDTNNRFDWVETVSGLLDNEYKNVPLISWCRIIIQHTNRKLFMRFIHPKKQNNI